MCTEAGVYMNDHIQWLLRMACAIGGALIVSGCVWPTPGPGEAVPTITTTTHWSATAETLTIDVSVSHLTPTTVRLYPRGYSGNWVETDVTAPFTFTIDISNFEVDDHEMLVIADDGATIVAENEVITVHGCNGNYDLCSRSYAQVRYATTHNAMSNSTDGWIGPNQALDVPQQLELGVRGLMLDTYRAGDLSTFNTIQVPDVDPDDSFLCHSLCAIGKQPLAEGLSEIREFLDSNPGAVITLIIESYLSHSLTASAFDAAGLTDYAYVHDGGAWPTLGQMIDSGDRLVVLQDKSVNPGYPWLMNVWSHAFETHFSAAAPGDFSCADNRGVPGNDLFIFNHFLTAIFGAPELAEQVNHNPLLIDRLNECEAFQSTPANFVTVDFVDIGDTILAVETLNSFGGF